jgi:hypothetical protein
VNETNDPHRGLGGFPVKPNKAGAPSQGIREFYKNERRARRRQDRTRRAERLTEHGEKMGEAGDKMASAGKDLFWLGICILFVVFVSIPILTHLF